ncbi:LysR family transcriptional regulator [Methylocystis heyeri]|uniref:LysR family transcriptional regulator n=1 Tax=Methylocystis heyeri TaxID=391905 RepID=A0A6B8KLE8_9HYPH|nr:LysR family transcriptional regulator [Methylocystis heyeri]QGM47608.1 LysR family transcriptional regulator [Methylocystis heyeri]
MDFRKVDLNLLVALDALLDERSVTRAAERLAMSQPALSNALHRLRGLFADPLFTRGQRGLIPTARALELALPIKGLLRGADELLQPQTFHPAATTTEFKIATTDYMFVTLLVPLIERLQSDGPGIAVTVRSLESPDIPDRLARGELDLAISIPEFSAPHLQSRWLYTDRYVGAMRRHHPLARIRELSIADLCGHPHTLVAPAGGRVSGPVDDALARLGTKRAIRASVPSFLALPYLLACTDLIAVCPERLSRTFGAELVVFEIPLNIPSFDVIAVWHARSHNDAAHRWLRQALAALSSETHKPTE